VNDVSANDVIGSISPKALWDLSRQQPIRLIDVRTPEEFAHIHAEGATNVPLDELEPATISASNEEPIYFICRAGSRSREACLRLRKAIPDARVMVVEGGTLAWREAELPLVLGPRLPRKGQTGRIILGSIIFASILLAIFVHRGLLGFAGLAAAWIVARNTLDPRRWLHRSPEEITEATPG
jgi:rhodanese-related sulfurtransferase